MGNEAKIKIKIMSLLFTVILGVYFSGNVAHAGAAHSKEVAIVDISLDEISDEDIQYELATSEHKSEDIVIVSKQVKEVTLEVSWYSEAYGDYDLLTLTLLGNYETMDSLNKDILAGILRERQELISLESIDEVYVEEIVYEVQYKYSEELVIGEELKLPSTKADGKYELSPLTVYISRCRISYVIEDGGEFFIPEDDYNFLLWENASWTIDDDPLLNYRNAFYNVDWKSFKEVGTVVGELNKVEKDHNLVGRVVKDRYTIGHQTYYRLSDIIEDWSTENKKLFQYDAKTKTLYYSRKPTAKDKLQKDEIYEFVKKAIKGCKTDKEKLKAIHDAIVTKYNVYEDWIYMGSFQGYAMRYDLYEAKKLMKDKAYSRNSFAALFKESCNRLLIPCDIVNDGENYWNRVYLGDKIYHVDTATDAIITQATKDKTPYRRFYLKSSYEFMGTHIWEGEDYTPEKFSKAWKNIDRNNIKTTDELRRAASYASYLCRDGKKRTYKFKITGKNVNTYCEAYVYSFDYINDISASYKKGILTITFN